MRLGNITTCSKEILPHVRKYYHILDYFLKNTSKNLSLILMSLANQEQVKLIELE